MAGQSESTLDRELNALVRYLIAMDRAHTNLFMSMLLRLYTQSKGAKTSKHWVLSQGLNLPKRPGLTGIL